MTGEQQDRQLASRFEPIRRELGQWWISVALGQHMGAVFLNGKRERWKTEEVGKGAVVGFHVGRLDYDEETP